MSVVVDRDVFPVDVGDLEAELAHDATIASDREDQRGIPGVVVYPVDARVTPALDDARRFRNRAPSSRPKGSRGGGQPKVTHRSTQLGSKVDMVDKALLPQFGSSSSS